jgi:undecaprenyl-diphosphatase
MIFAAKDLIFLVFLALVALAVPALRRRDWPRLVAVGASLVLSFALGLVAATVHAEPRPFTAYPHLHRLVQHAAGQSFPSDHATAAFALALAVGVFLSRRAGVVLFVAALLIGFSRVYDGIHYPGDILGSLAVSVVGVGIVAIVAGRLLGPVVDLERPIARTGRAA